MAPADACLLDRVEMLRDHLTKHHIGQRLYLPLSPSRNEFRLLDLYPSDFKGNIECSLRHASLTQGVEFVALSYAWGDFETRRPIMVNHQIVNITVNLFDALQHLRHPTKVMSLWVDALCINQENLDERAAEVLRMGDIFSMALRVEAWIGKDDESDHSAIEYIESLSARLHSQVKVEGLDYARSLTKAIMKSDIGQQELACSSAQMIVAVVKLFRHQWWKRLWVVQEMALADAQTAVARYGRKTIRWQTLIFVTMLIYRHGPTITSKAGNSLGDMLSHDILHGFRMLGSQKFSDQPQAPFTLTWLLFHHRAAKASDQRDRIYGLLGMSGDAALIGIQPNYSITPQLVYIDSFKKIVTATTCLDIICGSAGPLARYNHKLPSWVPDWSYYGATATESSRICIPTRCTSGDNFPGAVLVPQRYAASGSSRSQVYFSNETMITAAIKIGTVMVISSVNEDLRTRYFASISSEEESTISRMFLQSKTLSDWIHVLYTDPVRQIITNKYGMDNIIEVFYRILIADRNIWLRSPRSRDIGSSRLDDTSNAGCGGNSVPSLISPVTLLNMSLDHYMIRLRIISRRRLAILDTGHIGIVPDHTVIGDQAAILLGCSVPVLLRRINTAHALFIGESYFHGVMDGESLENSRIEQIHLV